MDITLFNIRVYGFLLNEFNEILLTDEFWFNEKVTKFPGGGLEKGEGPIDCLKRECIEELNQDISVINHVYTTDFFYTSKFISNTQLICIYYLIKTNDKYNFTVSDKHHDYPVEKQGAQSFRFVDINKINDSDLTFKSDQIAFKKLKEFLNVK